MGAKHTHTWVVHDPVKLVPQRSQAFHVIAIHNQDHSVSASVVPLPQITISSLATHVPHSPFLYREKQSTTGEALNSDENATFAQAIRLTTHHTTNSHRMQFNSAGRQDGNHRLALQTT
jgi:hypothetical protein